MLNAAALEVARAGNHMASTLDDVWKRVFSLPQADLLRILNENKAQVSALIEASGTFAAVLNPHLDALTDSLPPERKGMLPARVPTEIPRQDIAWDDAEEEWIAVDPEAEEE